MKSNQVKSLYYNPYFGNMNVEEIKNKEAKYNLERDTTHRREISLMPKDLLDDASNFIANSSTLLTKEIPLEDIFTPTNLKGCGTLFIMIAVVLLFSYEFILN